ncbi:MAG: hypothetical protein PVH77_09245 [Phycisphaerales bacterium]
MVEGLWVIRFISSLNMWGSGVLVLTKDKRILGGDEGYYYIGTYLTEKNEIRGNANVIQFNTQSVSVFGNSPKFCLMFKGNLKNNDNEFSAVATSPDFPDYSLKIEGVKKADLNE